MVEGATLTKGKKKGMVGREGGDKKRREGKGAWTKETVQDHHPCLAAHPETRENGTRI